MSFITFIVRHSSGVAKYKTLCYYAGMIPVKEKNDIISKFRIHDTDTGSSDVQIAVLSEEIGRLAGHLEKHPKDNHSRRGLLKMVAQRKKLLTYLSRENEDRYQVVIKKLGLKKWPASVGHPELDSGSKKRY